MPEDVAELIAAEGTALVRIGMPRVPPVAD
ncbi:hypothetical protein SAMN06893096_10834 [Geodermatophilus pulveris]|uniref:Uncharacterized protein n=1 Tax=Geodermatophilus pulveris TaxID=1564159 RepID=A0A239HCY7_9ACTN|nr:hypothetical protein SAMN06893096_10834 [Geodermatophilus pulveris]